MPSSSLEHSLNNATIGALAGALAGLVANLLINRWSRWRLYRKLDFISQPRVGARTSVRIYNGYIFPLNSVYAYITIENDPSDVLKPPAGYDAYISPAHCSKVQEDRLCWSIAPNPPCVDVYPGEKQSLDIVEFTNDSDWIRIPSESGWGMSRVFLKKQKYKATIKIVSKDTKAKEFLIEIDPTNNLNPIILR